MMSSVMRKGLSFCFNQIYSFCDKSKRSSLQTFETAVADMTEKKVQQTDKSGVCSDKFCNNKISEKYLF